MKLKPDLVLAVCLALPAGAAADELSYPSKAFAEADATDKKWFLDKIGAPLFWQKSKGSRSVKGGE